MPAHYHVSPRYCSGSPAMVDERMANRLANEEPNFYNMALSGALGDFHQSEAREWGLHGIVEWRMECAYGWLTHDLITDEYWVQPFSCDRGCQLEYDWDGIQYTSLNHKRGCSVLKADKPKAHERLARFRRTYR